MMDKYNDINIKKMFNCTVNTIFVTQLSDSKS